MRTPMLVSLAAALVLAAAPAPALAGGTIQPHGQDRSSLVAAPGLALEAPASVPKRTSYALTARLTGSEAPGGAVVVLQRLAGGTWTDLAEAVTSPDGTATFAAAADDSPAADLRALLRAEPEVVSAAVTVRHTDHTVRAPLTVPAKVVDGDRATLTVRLLSRVDGRPVPAASVRLEVRAAGSPVWRTAARASTGTGGRASFRVRPRTTVRYRTVTAAGPWWGAHTSSGTRVRNVPPGRPVVLPRGAPTPRHLPAQPRADRRGARAVVTRIPDGVWDSMRGRSWHPGCLPRSQLRLVRVNHYGFDGYRYRGELVVNVAVAGRVAAAFSEIHRLKLPVRAMYRVDRFGWSDRLGGADNYASMASDNTSAFNCRDVVGRPGVRSPHATGRAIDVNPFENPYWSPADGWTPNRWWVGRSHPRVAWRSRQHAMVKVMARHGIRWTYGTSDAHHFDA